MLKNLNASHFPRLKCNLTQLTTFQANKVKANEDVKLFVIKPLGEVLR